MVRCFLLRFWTIVSSVTTESSAVKVRRSCKGLFLLLLLFIVVVVVFLLCATPGTCSSSSLPVGVDAGAATTNTVSRPGKAARREISTTHTRVVSRLHTR